MTTPLANNHISVDCVLLGFDGAGLKVLLLSRADEAGNAMAMKLPGSLIYQDEDLDEAANRVLRELTGLEGIGLTQFKAFGSKDRTANPRDVLWLKRAQDAMVERIVTVAYFALVKLDARMMQAASRAGVSWVSLDEVGELAFDHNQIISEAVEAVRREVDNNRALVFSLIPRKFTMLQLRLLNETLYGRVEDVRNFSKKMLRMPYITPLDEHEKDVAHRAARLYKFDRKIYSKLK